MGQPSFLGVGHASPCAGRQLGKLEGHLGWAAWAWTADRRRQRFRSSHCIPGHLLLGAVQPPGYKIRVGELAGNLTEMELWSALWRSLDHQGNRWAYECILKLDIKSSRAASGASYCTITLTTAESAVTVHQVLWKWRAHVDIRSSLPVTVGNRRTLPVRFMGEDDEKPGRSRLAAAAASAQPPREHGAVTEVRIAGAHVTTAQMHRAALYRSVQPVQEAPKENLPPLPPPSGQPLASPGQPLASPGQPLASPGQPATVEQVVEL